MGTDCEKPEVHPYVCMYVTFTYPFGKGEINPTLDLAS